MISVAQLVAAGIAPTQARLFVGPLGVAMQRFEIVTPSRMAGFIAQCRVESTGFTQLEEGLYYKDADRIARIFPSSVHSIQAAQPLTRNPRALANCVYANRLGNGDQASGDGWRFRGRGLKQLTGRCNYHDASVNLGRPYVDEPDLVALPADACLTAAWFWHSIKANALADAGLWDAITRGVNGPGMLQASLRRQWSQEGVGAFA